MDLAAAIQQSLERIYFHVLSHHQQQTGHRNLCLAGGVAQNCSVNGKLLTSGMFDRVFVQPASYDAGLAFGAAIYASKTRLSRPVHLNWGTPAPGNVEIVRELESWGSMLSFEAVDNVCDRTATLLADGAVIGWFQGRSEFGPEGSGKPKYCRGPAAFEEQGCSQRVGEEA